jgi:hypothetical protein
MRTLLKLFYLFALISFFSCSDEVETVAKGNSGDSTNQNELINESAPLNTHSQSEISYDFYLGGTSVLCKGECEGGEAQACGTRWDLRKQTKTCTCESCYMDITIDNGLYAETANISSLYELNVIQEISAYILNEYFVEDDTVLVEEFKGFATSSNYILQVKFRDANGQLQSVAHSISIDNDKRFLIDCKGPCDDAEGICTEQFNLITGVATCTCEGGCNMTVTPVESLHFSLSR